MDLPHRTFTIELCLGRGGFGEVYRAEMASPTGLSSQVALKVLRRDLSPASQAVQRLRDEGALLSRLNHPTILRVHDLVILEGRASLITEFVDGDDLERCLRGPGPMGPRALAEVIGQVAAALDAAYNTTIPEHGGPLKLVHRDVKPSNIRIGRHGEVKLLDFGIARSDEVSREARTVTDMMVGSPPYMAPERFLSSSLRSASDVFALGAIGLEGLIGGRVFGAPVPMLASFAIDRNRYDAFVEEQLARVSPTAPEPFVSLCRRMLVYEPDARPSAAEVARACEALVDELPGATLARYCRDRRWLPPQREVGELDGRVLSEGTLARTWTETGSSPGAPTETAGATEVLAPPPPAIRRRGRATMWLVLSTAGVGAPILTALAVAATWALWPSLERSVRAPPPAAPVVAPAPDPAPVSEVPIPAPVARDPAPEPTEPTEQPTPRPRDVPEPRVRPPDPPEPEPTRPPEVVPAPSTAGKVSVSPAGDARSIRLIGADLDLLLPARVPPGTYTVRAEYEGGFAFERTIAVEPARASTVNCRRRSQLCTITGDR